MRMMLKVSMDVAAGNRAAKDGRLGTIIDGVKRQIEPEASYFFAERGKRTACFFFDLADPSQIPGICEPLFNELNAEIELLPVMNHDDLVKGLGR